MAKRIVVCSPSFRQYVCKHKGYAFCVIFFYFVICGFISVIWAVSEESVKTRIPCRFYERKMVNPPPGSCYRGFLQSPTSRFCLSGVSLVTLIFGFCIVKKYREDVCYQGINELSSFRKLDSYTAQIGNLREIYLRKMSARLQKEVKLEINVLLSEKSSILIGLEHVNIISMPIPNDAFHINLKDFAFGLSHDANTEEFELNFPLPHLMVIPVLLRDVIQAVQFLHSRHIFHLDLQMKNILIMNTSRNEIGYEAKVGGFEFAKCSQDGQVHCKEIGLDIFRRNQAYFIGDDVDEKLDGTKFDNWSIGLISFDVFTGGLLTILLEVSSISGIIPPFHSAWKSFRSGMFNISIFVAAIKSRWTSDDYFEFWCGKASHFYDLYLYFNFAKDCWNFTKGLILGCERHKVKVETIVNSELFRNTVKKQQKKRRRATVFIV